MILNLVFFLRSLHIVLVSLLFFGFCWHFVKVFVFMLCFDFVFLVWLLGFMIFFGVVVLTFLGYVLPVTQMSYWGLTVFSNIFTAVPIFGFLVMAWFWGSDFMQEFTLIKLHVCHLVLPFLLLFLLCAHLFVLHYYMSSDGFLDRFSFYLERVLFCTYMLFSDLMLFFVFFCLGLGFVYLGWFFVFHEESFIVCNLVKTSDKIMPEWFFLFFFGCIKSVPDKFFGLFCLCFFVFSFLLYLGFYFEYFGRCFSIFHFTFLALSLVFFLVSLCAVIVLLVLPCFLELQFFLLFLCVTLFWRF